MRVMIRRSIALFSALVALSLLGTLVAAQQPSAAPPTSFQGVITSNSGNECFPIKSGSIDRICGAWTIRWKLWSLMGEPVGNYLASWNVRSVRISGKNGRSNTLDVATLPAPLKRAADKIELYLDAVSLAATPDGASTVWHAFNTGVAVQSGGESSYNVPGSPDWGKLFFSRLSLKPCDLATRDYLPADAAKQIWKKGAYLSLYGSTFVLELCPQSGVSNLEPLTTAIADLCERTKGAGYGFCTAFCDQNHGLSYEFCTPHKVEKPAAEAKTIDDAFASLEGRAPGAAGTVDTVQPGAGSDIDSAFALMEKQKRAQKLAEAKARAQRERHDSVVASCTATVNLQNVCLAKSCGTEPAARICTQSVPDPPPRCNAQEGTSCLFIQTYSCMAYGQNPKLGAWRQCLASLDKAACTPDGRVQTVDQCVAEQEKFTPEPPSLLNEAKRKLRETAKCDPKLQKCPPPASNGGSGLRG
jgi:hypothetical protein